MDRGLCTGDDEAGRVEREQRDVGHKNRPEVVENQIAESDVIVQIALDILVDLKIFLTDQPGLSVHAPVAIRHQTGLEELKETKQTMSEILIKIRFEHANCKDLPFHLSLFVSRFPQGAVVDHQIELVVRFCEQPDLFAHTEPGHCHEER